jgi:fructose-1,6-bisphosphatase I / sedoheptulose-1,7-bisphosphatase
MATCGKTTLTQFLIETRRRHPEATGDLNGVITDVALACKAISRRVQFGVLAGMATPEVDGASAETAAAEPPEVMAHRSFVRCHEWGGHVAGMASGALARPYRLPPQHTRGKYLLLFDPLDGSGAVDVNVTAGSIFSVLRAPRPGEDPSEEDFLQPGGEQVAAGYAIYGPSTMLVLTLGEGTHAFTLEPVLGEWVLSHTGLRVAPSAREFAIDASNARFWEPAVKRYVDECLAGQSGPRGNDFSLRWIASLVAETHRILMRGGIFMTPRDTRNDAKAAGVRLLYEAAPIAMLIEQAGGRASTGRRRLLDVQAQALHERIGLIFGSADEVARIEAYHEDASNDGFEAPLFGRRGLFSASGFNPL